MGTTGTRVLVFPIDRRADCIRPVVDLVEENSSRPEVADWHLRYELATQRDSLVRLGASDEEIDKQLRRFCIAAQLDPRRRYPPHGGDGAA